MPGKEHGALTVLWVAGMVLAVPRPLSPTAAALTPSLPSTQEITRCLSQAVEVLARAIPSDLEREKAMLVLAMVLTKKVANKVPFLLQRVFSTTVNYISQHFHGYVARMVSADTAPRLCELQPDQTLGAGEAAASPCPLPCSRGCAAAALPSRGR